MGLSGVRNFFEKAQYAVNHPNGKVTLRELALAAYPAVQALVIGDMLPGNTVQSESLQFATQYFNCVKNSTGANVTVRFAGTDYVLTNNKSYLMFPEVAEAFKRSFADQGQVLSEVEPIEFNSTGEELFVFMEN